ncbi:MAG: hypothetical protein IIT63_02970 [Prevotella sp.]|nr:hypothetical protein [Prevotella sp.]
MKKDFVSNKVAKLLKAEGFNEPCVTVYSTQGDLYECFELFGPMYGRMTNAVVMSIVGRHNVQPVTAPTISSAVRWLAENNRIFLDTNMVVTTAGEIKYDYTIHDGKQMIENRLTELFETREAAYDFALQHILKDLL